MKKLFDNFYKWEIYLASAGLASCTVIIFVAALARSFDHPLNWSMDISLFLFAWSVFLGADAALRNEKLVNVDLLVKNLPASWEKILKLVILFVILVFLAALLVYGLKLSWTTRRRSFQGIPGFSYTWVTLSVPVGAVLQIFTILGKIINQFQLLKTENPRNASGGSAESGGRAEV